MQLARRLAFAAQMLGPEVPVEQELRERLDEDGGFEPDQMLVGIFGDQDLAPQQELSVQGAC